MRRAFHFLQLYTCALNCQARIIVNLCVSCRLSKFVFLIPLGVQQFAGDDCLCELLYLREYVCLASICTILFIVFRNLRVFVFVVHTCVYVLMYLEAMYLCCI